MTTSNTPKSRVENSLRGLLAEADDLPNLAAEWDGLDESVQVSTALDWDHLMASYLPEVERAYRAGELTDGQRDRYRLLRERLRETLPLFDRLNLYRPTVPLED